MLFNSSEYIFLFLSCAVFIYFLLNRFRYIHAATAWLVLASLFFYRYWNADYLQIMVSSIFINFAFGTMLHRTGRADKNVFQKRYIKQAVLTCGIVFNVGLLAYYKYADFFIANINQIFHTSWTLPHLLLPLAISFFTFQQIAYLVDCSRENAPEYDFLKYCLFVSFFPQLIAGPIVHHQEMMPQFTRLKNRFFSWPNVALGIFFFSLGLFKKVWIADQFSVWAAMGFDSSHTLTFFDAWGASLSYTFQLYFDFSGYTDMAIGSALFFNIVLPVNFNSPYRSVNIQDFWRRWHITLSRWLREYLYIPLGGNRKGSVRTLINLFITFLLAGLWHGAGWTFVIWGMLHGVALVVHRLWTKTQLRLPKIMGWLLTFLFVNSAWVIFRATTLHSGLEMLKSMIGMHGFSVTRTFVNIFHAVPDLHKYLWGFRRGPVFLPAEMYLFFLCFGLVVFLFPNSCQIGGLLHRKGIGKCKQKGLCVFLRTGQMLFSFRPNMYWGILSGILFSMALYRLLKIAPTEFLYFNF